MQTHWSINLEAECPSSLVCFQHFIPAEDVRLSLTVKHMMVFVHEGTIPLLWFMMLHVFVWSKWDCFHLSKWCLASFPAKRCQLTHLDTMHALNLQVKIWSLTTILESCWQACEYSSHIEAGSGQGHVQDLLMSWVPVGKSSSFNITVTSPLTHSSFMEWSCLLLRVLSWKVWSRLKICLRDRCILKIAIMVPPFQNAVFRSQNIPCDDSIACTATYSCIVTS